MTKKFNETVTLAKLINLQNALNDCGIKAEIEKVNVGEGIFTLSLVADLWNAVDGSNVCFEVYSDSEKDYEKIEHYALPFSQMMNELKPDILSW